MAFLVDVINYAQNVLAVVAGTPRTAASVNGPLQGLVNRTAFLKFISDKLWGTYLTVSGVDTGLDTLNVVGHGLSANQAVRVTTIGGSIPAPLNDGVVYYVIVVDSDNIKLSLASGPGAAVDLTGPMAGDVYVSVLPDWQGDLLMVDATYGTGIFASLVMWLAGTQTVTGPKTFDDITASGDYKYASSSPPKMQQGCWVIPDPAAALWLLGLNQAVANSNIISNKVFYQFGMPNGSTLTSVRVRVIPQVLGRPGLPATMPTFNIYKADFNGTTTPLATQIDTSASPAAYETPHTVSITIPSEVIDNSTYTYWLDLENESGANSAINTTYRTPETRCAITKVDRMAS